MNLENPPSVYLGNLANKFHLFEDLTIKFDESFNESGFNKMAKLLSRIIVVGRFLKSFSLSGLGKAVHGEYILSKILENKVLTKRLRKLHLENKEWWSEVDIG